MTKKSSIGDLLGLGLIIQGLFIFALSLREKGILMLIGVVGSLIILTVEVWFLINWFGRKNGQRH
ncbi:hypothetical protein ES703_57618 [subsurface metagenome]